MTTKVAANMRAIERIGYVFDRQVVAKTVDAHFLSTVPQAAKAARSVARRKALDASATQRQRRRRLTHQQRNNTKHGKADSVEG